MSGHPLKTGYNKTKPFSVHKQTLPEMMVDDYDYSKEGGDKGRYPFCVVMFLDGSKEGNQKPLESKFQVIIGVENEDLENAGYDDVMAAMGAILDSLNVNPYIAERYPVGDEIRYAYNDEVTHPYYFGAVEFSVQSSTLTSNRGGFLDDDQY